jgi:hypothetical protein
MDILDLTLKDYKLFSPVTGELIYDARKKFLNEDEKSLAGCWHYDSDDYTDYYQAGFDPGRENFVDFFFGTNIKNPQLFYAWESCLIEFPRGGEDPEDIGKIDLENFIFDYDDPNLICFRITNPEKPWERRYFVIEMNGKVECPE